MAFHWTWLVNDVIYTLNRMDLSILEAIQNKLGEFYSDNKESSHLPVISISRTQLKKYFDEKKILVNNKPAKNSGKLKINDIVSIDFDIAIPLEIHPENKPIDIIFEDSDIIVINKPPELSVHPSETQKENTLVHRLAYHIQDLSGIGGVLRPGIVHRIDKNTSGSLVIAKNDFSHQALSKQFSLHTIQRRYIALVFGSPIFQSLKVETLLGRHPLNRKKMAVLNSNGKKSISFFTRKNIYSLHGNHFLSLIEAELHTGRTHQIRVHLSHLGFPLVGDTLYSKINKNSSKWTSIPNEIQTLINPFPGQALHALYLSFQHPRTQKTLSFHADPPQHFSNILKALETYKL